MFHCSPTPIFASTVDHKVPRCRGGLDVIENSVASCGRCNNAKGDMTYELFLSIWRECLDAGCDIAMVESVCALLQRKNSFTPATQWNAVLAGAG